LYPTIDRPAILLFEDEGGLLPVHEVGLFGKYKVKTSVGTLHATVGVSNGRGSIVDDIRVIDDLNRDKAVLLSVHLDDFGMPGLRIGAGAIHDQVAPADASARPGLPDAGISEW